MLLPRGLSGKVRSPNAYLKSPSGRFPGSQDDSREIPVDSRWTRVQTSSIRHTFRLPSFTGFGARPRAIQPYHMARLTGIILSVPVVRSPTMS